jgi:hypothetical protein
MAEEYRGYAGLFFRSLVLTRLTPIFDSLASSCTPFSGLDRAAALRCIAKICYLQSAIYYSQGHRLSIAAAPFCPELAHHDNDAVPYVEQTLEQILKLRPFDQTIAVQLSRSFYRRRNRP